MINIFDLMGQVALITGQGIIMDGGHLVHPM